MKDYTTYIFCLILLIPSGLSLKCLVVDNDYSAATYFLVLYFGMYQQWQRMRNV